MTVGWFFILITAFTGLSAWIASRTGELGAVQPPRVEADAGNDDQSTRRPTQHRS